MVSYDDLPEDPFDRRTEIDRRIENEIVKIIARRKRLKRAGIVVGLLVLVGIGSFISYRMTNPVTSPSEHIAAAADARDRGDLAGAIKLLDLALSTDPSRLGARRLRAELALALGNAHEAREHLRLASPDGRSRIVSLGLLRADLLDGKFTSVSAQAAATLEHSRNEDLEVILAQADLGRGEIGSARVLLDKLLLRFPDHTDGLLTRAHTALAERRPMEAAKDRKTLSQLGRVTNARLLEGEIELAKGQPVRARSAFDALEIAGLEHPEQAFGLARAAIRDGDSATVSRLLDSLPTTNPHVRFLSTWALWMDDHHQQAQTMLDTLLQDHPNHLDARFLGATLAESHGDSASALAHLDALMTGRPDQYASVLAAKALLSAGNPTAALGHLQPWAGQTPLPANVAEILESIYTANEDGAALESLNSAETIPTPPRPALFRCNVIAYTCERCLYVRVCS